MLIFSAFVLGLCKAQLLLVGNLAESLLICSGFRVGCGICCHNVVFTAVKWAWVYGVDLSSENYVGYLQTYTF